MTPQEEIDRLRQEISQTFIENVASEIDQALKSQLSTALSEALALRVEVERLRAALNGLTSSHCLDHLDSTYETEKIVSSAFNALQQPTPTGLTDKLLRLVVDTLRHMKGIEQWSTVQNTAAALTSDEVDMIENLLRETKQQH